MADDGGIEADPGRETTARDLTSEVQAATDQATSQVPGSLAMGSEVDSTAAELMPEATPSGKVAAAETDATQHTSNVSSISSEPDKTQVLAGAETGGVGASDTSQVTARHTEVGQEAVIAQPQPEARVTPISLTSIAPTPSKIDAIGTVVRVGSRVPQSDQEVRGWVAVLLISALLVLVVTVAISALTGSATCYAYPRQCVAVNGAMQVIKGVLDTSTSAVVGLVGAVTGFYFGANANKPV